MGKFLPIGYDIMTSKAKRRTNQGGAAMKTYAGSNKKMLNMLILEILRDYTDAEHHLTQQEIIDLLRLNYGMECDRRSIRNNIRSLKDMG
ncbi:MAG: hypothetical protein J6Y13_02200, partial [Treponema sp.]|nr:hypothetical protein [Treponema sp.]